MFNQPDGVLYPLPVSTYPYLRWRGVSSCILYNYRPGCELDLLNNVVKKKAPYAGYSRRGRKYWMSDSFRSRGLRLAARGPGNNRHSSPVLAPSRFILAQCCGPFFSV